MLAENRKEIHAISEGRIIKENVIQHEITFSLMRNKLFLNVADYILTDRFSISKYLTGPFGINSSHTFVVLY